MANTKNFIAKNGVSTGDGYAMPDVRPSLLLDFANSKTLDPRITFTRGSTATYWDGKTTAKAEENLIPYSDFSDGWTDEGSTTTTLNNDTAPDGTTTAARLFGVNGDTKEYKYVSLAISNSGKLTGSVYLKEAGQRYAYVQLIAGTTSVRQSVLFDLNTGTQVDAATQGSPTGVSYSITSVGNNWYRCVVTMDQSSSSNGYLLIGMAQSASPAWTSAAVAPVTGTTSDTIIIWGAQLEQRDSLTTYTATSGSPIVKYQPTLQTAASGEARFDHDPVTGESKGLLIEEARTNLQRHSETFGTTWSATGCSVSGPSAIAPDGTNAAVTVIDDTTTARHGPFDQTNTITSGSNYTLSCYLKKNYGTDYAQIHFNSGSVGNAWVAVLVNLANGTVENAVAGSSANLVGSGIEDVGNGWYRAYVTGNYASTEAHVKVLISNTASPSRDGYGNINYTGAYTRSILVWGAQLEAGSFPTSYIPTSGSTVTRSADNAQIQLTSDFYNEADTGIFYLSGVCDISDQKTVKAASVTNDSAATDLRLFDVGLDGSDGNIDIYGNHTSGGLYQVAPYTNGETFKVAFTMGYQDAAASSNGGTVKTYTTGTSLPPTANWLNFGRYATNYMCGHLNKVSYYPQRLSNATLQAMTEA